MEKTMKKKTALISIGIAGIFLMVSFTSAVGFQSVRSSKENTNSPLFHLRLRKITDPEKGLLVSSSYVGKDKPLQIPLPSRDVLTEEIINQLSSEAVKEKVRFMNCDLLQKWESILSIAKNNLAEINSIIRQDYTEFQRLVADYYNLSEQGAKDQFLEKISAVDRQELNNAEGVQAPQIRSGNITSGPICNITSGHICQITTQPICKITTQPICSIITGFFCWTIYGPICPTTGIKCHPPTSRPKLCSLFLASGKILKTIIILVLLAVVIFVPLAILTFVLMTVFAPARCDQIHERITTWFNCTTPE
jgi:hypothetical protein